MTIPNKTIYIKDGDKAVWDEAQQLAEVAEDSLSGLLTEALRAYVEKEKIRRARRQHMQETMEEIRIDLSDAGGGGYPAKFIGRWLVYPNEDSRTTEDHWDAGTCWGVALTGRGQIAVFAQHVNERFPPRLDTYANLEAAEGHVPGDILAQAGVQLGEDYVQELDI